MYDVFISHSSKNAEVATSLVAYIEENGLKCFIAPRDIVGGISYAEQLVHAINDCEVFLLLVSEEINKSEQVLNELEIAVDNNKIILPFKIDESTYNDSYKYYLKRKHWINAIPDPVLHFAEVLKTIQLLMNKGCDAADLDQQQYLVSVAEKNKRNLINETSEKRLSFGLSIEDDKYGDSCHVYNEIKRFDLIDSSTGMYTSYRWLTITNVSNKATNFIYHKECGENKIYFSDLKFRAKAYASDGERKLIVDSITEIQPNFIQVCKIHFGKNLTPGESIRIFYRLDWPGEALSFYKGELSTSISLTRYKQGVETLVFGIMQDKPLYAFELYGTENSFITTPSDKTAIPIHCDDIPELKKFHGRNFAGAYYTINEASSRTSYRIIYKIIDNAVADDDDEDF